MCPQPERDPSIASGTRLVARNEAVKDGLLDCGAMQAMIKIASMFSRNNCDVESMAVVCSYCGSSVPCREICCGLTFDETCT